MNFREAEETKLPFGKHRGRTIGEVAKTDDGLRYLDWMISVATSEHLKDALESYLLDPSIKGEVQKALGRFE